MLYRVRTNVVLIGLLSVLMSSSAMGGKKYQTANFHGKWTGNEGMKVTAGTDTFTANFTKENGTDAAGNCAQKLVDAAVAPFEVSRVGTKVTICHPTKKPKIKKVNMTDNRKNSAGFFSRISADGALLASDILIEVRGSAAGDGTVSVTIEDLVASVTTSSGQSAEEVVDALVAALDDITPDDDTSYAFGTEFTADSLAGEPTDSVDLGITSLGGRNLQRTTFESTDSGISMFQEPTGACCGPQGCVETTETECAAPAKYQGDGTVCADECPNGIPTVSEWGLVVMGLLVLTAGTVVVMRRRRAVEAA